MKSVKPLTREIRKLARKRLRAKKPLWKEYQRLRRTWRTRLRRQTGSVGIIYLLAVAFVIIKNGQSGSAMLLLSMYSLATSIGRAAAFSDLLYRSGNLAYFMHTPATDREFFEYEWPATLRSSAMVWVYSLCAFSFVATSRGLGGAGYAAAVVAATLQWLLILSVVVVLTKVHLNRWVRTAGTISYFAVFACVFLPAAYVPGVERILLVSPSSWIPFVFEDAFVARFSGSFYFLVPALLVIAVLPLAFRRLRDGYPQTPLVYPFRGAGIADFIAAEMADSGDVDAHGRPRALERGRQAELTRALLQEFDWKSSGWLERVASRTFSQRDKQVAEFLCGGVIGQWSASWLLAMKIAAVELLTLPWFFDPRIGLVLGAVASLVAVPVFGGKWAAMRIVNAAGTIQPICAAMPLSYWDVTSVVMKVNLVRYAVWLPVFLSYGALLGWRALFSPWSGVEIVAWVFLILVWSQPIVIIALHSVGTNDTRRITLHSMLAAGLIILLAIAYVAAIIIFTAKIAGTDEQWFVLSIPGFLLCPAAIWFVYKAWYQRGKLDTVRIAD